MFIAMAYYGGESLKERLDGGPLEVTEAVDIISQVATGLSKAHEKNIVHRDIKPANILLTPDGVAKIVDFGLAKLEGRTKVTRTGTTVGTVAYMSPEQALGEDVDHCTDIWSLGVVLYEMLTGERPFPGDNEAAIVYRIANEEPPPLVRYRTDLSPVLHDVLDRTLKKDRSERYQSIGDVITELKSIEISKQRKKNRKATHFTFHLLAATTAIVILAGGYVAYKALLRSRTQHSSPTVDSQHDLIVAVAPFWGHNPDAMDQGHVMRRLVEREIERNLQYYNDVQVVGKDVTDIPRTDREAKQLGRRIGAKVVIWGEVLMVGTGGRDSAAYDRDRII